MANTQEKWQEIANRGLQDKFDPSTRAKFDEAVRRGLITAPQVQQAPPMEAQPESAQVSNLPPQQPQPETTIAQDIGGGLETAATMVSGIVA